FVIEARDGDLGAACFPLRALPLVAHDDPNRLTLGQKSFGDDLARMSRDSSDGVHGAHIITQTAGVVERMLSVHRLRDGRRTAFVVAAAKIRRRNDVTA